MRLWVAILFREAKVDNVNQRRFLAQTNQEIVGLDIAVNEVFGVHILDTRQLDRRWVKIKREKVSLTKIGRKLCTFRDAPFDRRA